MSKFDLAGMDQRKAKLNESAAVLKSEFFGNDHVIDLVMQAISAWYIFPALITRPVIVNLWGLTGVGKTQLVRRLAQLLGFSDRFVEVQMDGISSGGGCSTIEGLLASSSIEEGVPGILLLDEIQRYRTIEDNGAAVKLERYQDVWMLLSDGKFAANSSAFRELEMMLAYQTWEDDREATAEKSEEDKKKALEKKKPTVLFPYEARRFKKLLRLPQTIHEVMKMTSAALMDLVNQATESKQNRQLDYSKLLVFVSGNLDEAYSMAEAANDCDTDADVFHAMSKQISVMNIKKALGKRFKPEQISRFGNNHIIYPSLSRRSYQQLIEHTCAQYLRSMADITGISLTLDDDSREVIYQNSVYPSQGTRPVFSSVHKIFSDGLVQISFQAIQDSASHVDLRIEAGQPPRLVGVSNNGKVYSSPLQLDVNERKAKATEDFRTLVAVHEAGHALIYALLTCKAPSEIKINAASYSGGFTMPAVNADVEPTSVTDQLDRIAVLYAGRCAEDLVFGKRNLSTGAQSDLEKATDIAAQHVRSQCFGGLAGVEKSLHPGARVDALIPDAGLDKEVGKLLVEQRDRASLLLLDNRGLLVRLVSALLDGAALTPVEFAKLFPELDLSGSKVRYVSAWNAFSASPAKAPRSSWFVASRSAAECERQSGNAAGGLACLALDETEKK